MAAVSPAGTLAPPDAALAGLYERHADRVFGYCLKWLRSREEAEDAVQTTFLYAMRGLRRGVTPVFEPAWILAIARNVCLNRTASARRRSVEIAHDPHVLEECASASPAIDDLEGIAEALAELTELQRRAILMREWQGLSYKEIAEELQLSQSAVETLIFRARRALAARLRGAASFLPWVKSIGGGAGAAKIVAGVTAVAVTAAAGTVAATRTGGADVAARPNATAAAKETFATGSAHAPVRQTGSRTQTPRTPVQAKTVPAVVRAAPAAVVPATAPTAPVADRPVATPPAPAPAPTPATQPNEAAPVTETAPPPTEAAKPVTEPVTRIVETVVPPVTETVGTLTDTATQTVGAAVDTVKQTVTEVTTTVTSALPPPPSVPLLGAPKN
jgi:RNA polymerase sigma factor (sigma-70 family)